MKITAIKPYPAWSVWRNVFLVKIETDEGIYGWGESYTQLARDRTIEIHIQQLARYLIGRDPFKIKKQHWVMDLIFPALDGAALSEIHF